jgi:hypothetical protein
MHHPSASSQTVECYKKTMGYLKKGVEMHQIDWDERLHFFLLPYRVSVSP